MTITGIANEVYMEQEFIYYNDNELSTILMELTHFKDHGLVKGDINVIPCNICDNGKGCVYACVRADSALDTLIYRLQNDKIKVTHKIKTIYDDIINIDAPF